MYRDLISLLEDKKGIDTSKKIAVIEEAKAAKKEN